MTAPPFAERRFACWQRPEPSLNSPGRSPPSLQPRLGQPPGPRSALPSGRQIRPVRGGDLLSIMGPSGCGKSTLMNILGLLDRPTAGRRLIKGREIVTMDDDEISAVRNATIGFVFQSFHLLPRLSAAENAGLPLIYRGLPEARVRERALDALDRVGMADRAGHRPGQLSGGQQQRVALARALVGEPLVILADEPTGALDPDTAGEVMDTFETLCADARMAVVIVTHSPEVSRRCGRRTRLDAGMLHEEAT